MFVLNAHVHMCALAYVRGVCAYARAHTPYPGLRSRTEGRRKQAERHTHHLFLIAGAQTGHLAPDALPSSPFFTKLLWLGILTAKMKAANTLPNPEI